MNTKERITRKALSLFNQSGVYSITTNHIAQALQISPGNLYYHFKDKEDIIRSIYDQMIKFMDSVWINGKQEDPVKAIVDILFATMKLQYKYRFFYREIGVLLEKDPILRTRYNNNRSTRLQKMLDFLLDSETMGVLKMPQGTENQQLLMETIWFIIEWGIQYGLVLTRSSAKTLIINNIRMLILFINPYLSLASKEALEQSINKERNK